MRYRPFIVLAAGAAVISATSSFYPSIARPQATPAKVESLVLVNGEPGLQYTVSPKGQHLAAVVLRGSRQVMVHDGVDGPRMDEVLRLPSGNKVVFSDDGNRFAYCGKVGQEFVIVVDGKEVTRGPWSPELAGRGLIPVHDLGFTPGSKHWYAVLQRIDSTRTNYQMSLDGKPGPVAQEPPNILWSTDGEHHAYLQQINPATGGQRSTALVLDGKAVPYLAGEMQFTADGLHLFSKRIVPGTSNTEVLADGNPVMRTLGVELFMSPVGAGFMGVVALPPQNNVRTLILTIGPNRVPGSDCTAPSMQVYMSPDAKHYAAKCQNWVMVDGKKGDEYAGGISSDVYFTADGRGVYQATTNGKNFMVIGAEESDAYSTLVPWMRKTSRDQRGSDVMLPFVIQGNSVGYIGRKAAGGNEMAVVINGKVIPTVAASQIVFSPDGSRFAYISGQPAAFITVDGTGYPTMVIDPGLGNVGYQGPVQWTPDSKHVAWSVSSTGGGPGFAIDGKFFATPNPPRYMTFTADRRHLICLVRQGGRVSVLLDGVQVLDIPWSQTMEIDADIYWGKEKDGTIQLVAQDGEAIKRFKIIPGTETSIDTLLAKAVVAK